MKANQQTRRQVLRGLGTFTLALPLLPSLLTPSEAAAGNPSKRRFVQFMTGHGGIWGNNMYPSDATLTETLAYAGHSIRRGALALPEAVAGDARLSPVLSGPSSLLSSALVSKLNVLRGCDIPFYISHHSGGHLGNFARNDANADDGRYMQSYATPTIDQLMAWSPAFYADLSSNRARALVIGDRCSYNWSDPVNKTGTVEPLAGSYDALALFRQIFVPMDDSTPRLTPVVDRVLEDYKRLRHSNTRLSADDARRLDDHMQRLSELERRLNVHVSCSNVTPVTVDTRAAQNAANFLIDPRAQAQVFKTLNDVIVAAMLCDTSRIATVSITTTFSDYVGDWHADVAHHSGEPDALKQGLMVGGHQAMFAEVFLDLCSKLDIDDGAGKTYLDDSLVVWTQEAGEYTHAGQGMPIVTAGSAGGFLKTGNYCDYRNTSESAVVLDPGEQGNTAVKIYPGLLWQQWLGTALQAMGLAPSDYEAAGLGGYPCVPELRTIPTAAFFGRCYPDSVWSAAGELLPFLRA